MFVNLADNLPSTYQNKNETENFLADWTVLAYLTAVKLDGSIHYTVVLAPAGEMAHTYSFSFTKS